MRQDTTTLTVQTGRHGSAFHDITDEVAHWVRGTAIGTGLLTVFIPHTSASLTIQENADPDVLRDLETFFKRIVPEDPHRYRHTAEGADDMPAHIRSALTATSLSVPVRDGAMVLGTWQALYLIEHRSRSHRRHVELHLIGA